MRPSPLAAIDHSHGAQPDPAALASALRAQQVRMHGDNVPWATAGALVLALLFVGVQWRAIAHGPLLGWLAALLLVLAWRAGLWVWQRRQGADTGTHRPGDATWLRLYRANFLAHGLVWAAASALPMPAHEPMQLALLVMMLAGIATSNFILNAFDLAAALLFGVPAIGALALRLLLDSDGVQQLMGLAVLLALGFFVLTGRRTHRMVRENSALRLAEAHHNHLLRVLIESTSEGFWFIDTQAVTVDANPAMCQLLGLPRAALVGRSIYDFVDAENRAIFERELVPRISGAGSGYEITLRRADGSLVDCFNQATPILDPQGRRVGSVGLWTDISVRKRAERALQETSEALRQKSQALEDTLASIGQGIVSYDGQGRLRAHNRRLLELLDMPAALFQPQSTYVDLAAYLTARGDLRPGQALLDASGQPLPPLASPEHLPDLYVRRTPAGLLLEVRTLRLADGGMVRTFSDVTAYIQALRSLAAREREQRDLLEAFPGYIAVTDQAYRYGYVNQRFASLVGRPREQIIDRPATEVLGEGRFAQMRTLLDRTRPGELVHTESDYPATAWRPRIDLQVTHAVSQDPATGARRVYAFAIDISARKAAETALVAARDEAERANRAKSQFLSSMSHELRTPLHAILGFGQLLATDKAHPLAPPQQAQMEEILRGANHLLHLINEVLDLAVVETGSLSVHLQPVALAPVLAEALALLRPLAGSRGITLPAAATGLAETAMVQADPVRLKQVLLNLLGNAIKYNRPQGQVRVHCEALALAGGTAGGAARNAGWRIVVQDTGLGLDAARQARLFSAFDRLGAEAGQVEGTGLGLALSRGLVRAMGGDIGVISQPGEGSSFWLQLPPAASGMLAAPLAGLAPPATPPPATRPTATAPASPAHPLVLYVEDNPVNRMLMEAVFDQLPGLQLRMACNAAQGLQMALEQPPQLVLLDIQLPDMDGHALLQLLRQQPQLRQLPVIAVSADALPDTIARGRGAGFTDYLAKPVDVEQLAAAVHAALGRR